jgi:hypothetical protein
VQPKIPKGQSTERKTNLVFADPAKKIVWSDKLQCLPNANPNAKSEANIVLILISTSKGSILFFYKAYF